MRGILSQMNSQSGAVLLMVLVSVSLIGLMAGIAGSSWQTYMQKSREADLLWKGNQIREAIGRYYEFVGTARQSSGTAKSPQKKTFPQQLEDLLDDPRTLETVRHLRRLYPDPMTNEEWEIVRSAKDGGIMGVKSTSTLKPFKQYGFSDEDKTFAAQSEYRGWSFVYTPGKGKTAQPTNPTQKKPAEN